MTKRLLSIDETARMLGIAPRTIYNRIAPSAKSPFPIKAKRVGRRVLLGLRMSNHSLMRHKDYISSARPLIVAIAREF